MERIVDGKYRVGPLVGRGAMGSVYRARHVLTQVEVALKLVPPNVALTPQGQERFKREVAIAALVGHPGIVRVLDAGVDPADQTHYVVMEHLVGEDLAARALRDDFTVADGVTAVRTALDPLAAAHRHGVVHRDLKPENIFLHAADGGPMQVKLLDFGIARDRKFTNTVTAEDVALGTPNYMSPEQATNARSVTPASDVWSMGVLLYWLLAGHLPFERDNAFLTLRAVCSEPPRPIAMVGGPATQALVDLTMRCLDKDPLRRPQDASALAIALDEVLGIFRAASSQESAGYREPTATLEMTPGPAADRAPTGERPPAAPILNAPTEPSAAPRAAPILNAPTEPSAAPLLLAAPPPSAPTRRAASLAAIALLLFATSTGLGWWLVQAPATEVAALETQVTALPPGGGDGSESEHESESESESESEAASEAESESASESDAEAEAASESDAESASEAKSGTRTGRVSREVELVQPRKRRVRRRRRRPEPAQVEVIEPVAIAEPVEDDAPEIEAPAPAEAPIDAPEPDAGQRAEVEPPRDAGAPPKKIAPPPPKPAAAPRDAGPPAKAPPVQDDNPFVTF